MKIVIQYDEQCPFLLAVCKILSAINNEVILWQTKTRSIYEMTQQIKPDLLIVSNLQTQHWDVIENIPYIVYGDIDLKGKAIAKIPKYVDGETGFVDLVTYRNGFSESALETDILVSSNYFSGDMRLMILMDKIFNKTEFTLKCTGSSVLPTPYFIGACNEQEFMSVAKSAKIVIAANDIERKSLIYNKVYACTVDSFDDKMVTEEKLRRKRIKEERKEIIDAGRLSTNVVCKLLELINLPGEVEKVKQISGNLL